MNVLIHADGGPGIGLGHVARCCALANAFSRCGHHAVVAVDPTRGLADYVQRQGVTVMPSRSTAQEVHAVAETIEADCLVVDSYEWSGDDFVSVRGNWSLVAFDDQAVRELPVDAVINGSPGATKLSYRTSVNTRLLLGPAYQVVRDDFRVVPARRETGKIRQVIAIAQRLGVLPGQAGLHEVVVPHPAQGYFV